MSERYSLIKGDFNFADTNAYEGSKAYKRLSASHYERLAREIAEKEETDIALAYLQVVNTSFPNGDTKDDLMFNYLRYGMKANSSLEEVYNVNSLFILLLRVF